jgi:hypothetical protein
LILPSSLSNAAPLMSTSRATTEFTPTPTEIEEIQRKFDLSYHVPYGVKAAQEVGFTP